MIKKTISSLLLCVGLSLMPVNTAHSEELVTTLSKGQPAPFNGTLFNTQATARLLTDLEFTEQSCQIEIDREVGETRAIMQFEIDKAQARVEATEEILDTKLKLRDESIDMLSKELEKARKPNQAGWFVGGVAAGILFTAVGAWSVDQVAHSHID